MATKEIYDVLREVNRQFEDRSKKEEFKEIINKDSLTPEKLWLSYEENFYAWRKKNDLPRILNHLRQKLHRFDEWQRIWFMDDSKLIGFGISNCISSKSYSCDNLFGQTMNHLSRSNPYKYIMEREWEGSVTEFISEKNLDGRKVRYGSEFDTYRKRIALYLILIGILKMKIIYNLKEVIHIFK